MNILTPQEFKEGNELIAKHLGWWSDDGKCWYRKTDCSTIIAYSIRDNYPYNDLPFYRSWDALMPVIEKINQTHNKNADGSIIVKRDLTYTINYLLGAGYRFAEYEREWLPMTLENLWKRCVEFIKWDNEQKVSSVGA